MADPTKTEKQEETKKIGMDLPGIRAAAAETKQRFDQLKELATADTLTGLHNRRGFEEILSGKIAESKREGSPLYVLFFDIDNFKAFNTVYGHAGGDEVLKLVKSLPFRPQEPIARWGGEEFIQALDASLSEENIIKIVNRYNLSMQKLSAERLKTLEPIEGERLSQVTFSIGVAKFEPNEAPEVLISRANAALLKAKGNGRNTYVMAHLGVDGEIVYRGPKITNQNG